MPARQRLAGGAVPLAIPAIKLVATYAIAKAWNKIKNIFDYKAKDEENRWAHRKEEAITWARQLESRLNIIIRGLNEGTYPLNEAIRDHAWHLEEYTRFNHYIPKDRYPWEPHDTFDYPSAKGGCIALLEIYKEWMPLFESVLYKGFPTYDWQFVAYRTSPTSATDPLVLQNNAVKLAIPAGILLLGIVLSS